MFTLFLSAFVSAGMVPASQGPTHTYLADHAAFTGGRVIKDRHDVWSNLPPTLFELRRENVTDFRVTLTPGTWLLRVNSVERDANVNAAGARVFAIEGPGVVWDDIDVWEQAGGHHVPLVHAARIVTTDGNIHLRFRAKAGATTVSSIELIPAASEVRDAPGAKTLEDFRRFAGKASFGSSDDTSGWVQASLQNNVVRFDYRVDAHLPYGNNARLFFPLPQPVSLNGQHSLRFDLAGDGSKRVFGLTLHGAKGETATFWVPLDFTSTRTVEFSLDHVSSKDAPNPAPLAFAVTGITFLSRSDAAAALGQGQVLIGPVRTSSASVAPPGPTSKSDFAIAPEAIRIEGFESYADDRALWDNVGATSHANIARLRLAHDAGFVGAGKQSLRMDYTFDKRPYSGIVFFRTMDIRQQNVFRFWYRGDGSRNRLMVFFALGQIHQFEVPLSNTKGRWVNVPLDSFLGETARRNGVIEIGLWARRSGKSEGGTIYLDDIGLAFDPKQSSNPAARPAPLPIPPGGIHIDTGSDEGFTDSAGTKWVSDRGYVFGRTHILNPGELAHYKEPNARVHQTFRVGMAGYAFAVSKGAYSVRLVMAENWLGAKVPGRRVCNITVGTHELGDVDIIAETRTRFAPLVKEVEIESEGGGLSLEFRDKANHCKLDALEIVPRAGTTSPR